MIYPIPQKNELTGEEILVKSVSLSGEFKEIAEKVFEDYSIPCNDGLSVVFKYENSKETTYCVETARLTDEKYIIIVSENEIIVKASCDKSSSSPSPAILIISNWPDPKTGCLFINALNARASLTPGTIHKECLKKSLYSSVEKNLTFNKTE